MPPTWIEFGKPALVLAPMEGVTDAPMRALLTERGGFDFCVSEFLRVGQTLYPDHVFFRHIPELGVGCTTPSGVPVQVQLLGGDEELMAQSAVRAVRLGATAIDLNFGCPSKTVTRHDGGALLLQYPERIRSLVHAVRAAVPAEIPVSAKLRLGWENESDIFHNAVQAYKGGASWLTIHARTKRQGYAPPAHWAYIGEVQKQIPIPVVANGDIWTREDFLRCQEITGCQHFMIGRGAMANPALPLEIASLLKMNLPPHWAQSAFQQEAHEWEPLLARFSELNQPLFNQGPETVLVGRMKQWLKFSHVRKPLPWFDQIKRTQSVQELLSVLQAQ